MAKGKIHKMAERMEEANKKIDDEIVKIIKQNEDYILNLNRSQLFSGIDSKGKSLGKYKSKWYAALKLKMNPRGVVDLLFSGKFQRNFFIKIKNLTSFQIDSKDSKRNKLVGNYGIDIFGLTQQNKKVFAYGFIREGILKYYRKVLHVR